ncbi:MAG: EAL domain-containing protein, partial [Geminicoccaceae bacterium]
ERQAVLQWEAEARALAQGIRSLGRALADEARDYGWWDDAVRHLVIEPDPAWADANVGRYIHDSFGYEVSIVLDGAGLPTFGQIDGERGAADAMARLGPDLPRLARQVTGQDGASEPATAFAVLSGADGLYAVAAAPIVPSADSTLARPRAPEAALIFAKRLDAVLLRRLEQDFGLHDLALVPQRPQGMAPAVALPGLGLTPAAYLNWSTSEPGREQLLLVLPALLGAILFCGFVALLVGARDRAHREISDSEARFRDVAETAADWIWETDREQRLTFVSEACRRSLEVEPRDLLGRRLPDILEPFPTPATKMLAFADLTAHGPFGPAMFRARSSGGAVRVLRVAGKPVHRDRVLIGHRGIATDVTAEVGALERARYLAHHDALTGLANRVLLQERLEEIAARSQRRAIAAAVLCLDLDGFKAINDTMGHAAGDRLLVECGERLRQCVRASDTVARQGGDEFAILQSDVGRPAEIESLCRRVVDAVAMPFDLGGQPAQVTVSIGIAVMPEDGHDADHLLQRADMALYRAKSGGRNQFCFYEPGMDRQLRERREAEAELRAALVQGGLQLLYQPQVDCASGELVGLEALLRWHHPRRGTLLPAEIIPLAEETGIIHALGAWVLRTACRDALGWGNLKVSVNVSPVQFRHPDFPGQVTAALTESGLAPDRLELEVTEGLLVHDTGAALATLAELKAMGTRITMDDFGTGYSSLAYLHRFPFDKIKIDRSFIRQLGGSPNTRDIVRAMVQLGRSLAVPVCAEGVETAGQLAQLRDEGCQEVQGYLFAHPVPSGSVAALMAGWCGETVRRPVRLLAPGAASPAA